MRIPTAPTVSAYIAAAPAPARAMLKQLRAAVRAAAPKAEERISYGMPSYRYRGALVSFAAFKSHVSLFVRKRILMRYPAEVEPYLASKATLHFTLGTRIPLALVKKLITAGRKENDALKKEKP